MSSSHSTPKHFLMQFERQNDSLSYQPSSVTGSPVTVVLVGLLCQVSTSHKPVLCPSISRRPILCQASINRRPVFCQASISRRPVLCQASISRRPIFCQASINRRAVLCQASISRRPVLCQASISRRPILCQASISRRPVLCQASINRRPVLRPTISGRPVLCQASINRRPVLRQASISRRPVLCPSSVGGLYSVRRLSVAGQCNKSTQHTSLYNVNTRLFPPLILFRQSCRRSEHGLNTQYPQYCADCNKPRLDLQCAVKCSNRFDRPSCSSLIRSNKDS